MSVATTRRRTNPWVVLVLVCLAQFMVILDATIVNVALPSIQRGLHFSASDLQWVINGYTLTFGGFLLLGGRSGDLLGRQRVFLAGVVVFTVASAINGLAQSAGMLIVGRALQGVGGAMVSPAALSIITTTFDEGSQRTKALGIWSAIAAGGAAFGLLLGGILTDAFDWRWIFFVNVPVGVAAFALSWRLVPNSRGEDVRGGVDVAGAVAVTAGLVALVYVIVKAPEWGWTDGRTLGFGAAALALLAAFVVLESRIRHPLVRLSIFRIRSLAIANGTMLLVASGLFSMFYFMSIYVQEILGYSPLRAGLAFLPVTAGIGAGAAAAQQLIKRLGVRGTAVLGLAIASVGMLLITRIGITADYAGTMLPGLIVMAVGMGLTFVPITLVATTNVDMRDAGLASGLLNTSQQLGGALGLAILSSIAINRTTSVLSGLHRVPSPLDGVSAMLDGFHLALLVAAGLMVAGGVLVAVLLRRRDVANVATGAAFVEPAGDAVA